MVEVVLEDETVEEHVGFLTIASPVFRAMLNGDMVEAKSGRIELVEKRKAEYETVLRFLRPDTARTEKIHEGNVNVVVEWSDKYGISNLKQECEEVLGTLPFNIDRLVQASTFSLQKQYGRCLQWAAENFEDLPIEDLMEKHPSIMKDLLPMMKKCKKEQHSKVKLEHEQAIRRIKEAVQKCAEGLYSKIPGTKVTIDEKEQDPGAFAKQFVIQNLGNIADIAKFP